MPLLSPIITHFARSGHPKKIRCRAVAVAAVAVVVAVRLANPCVNRMSWQENSEAFQNVLEGCFASEIFWKGVFKTLKR